MAEIEEALKTYLLTKTALTALVSTRVLSDDVSNGAALPAVVYQKISDVKDYTHDGQSKLESPTIQYSAYAETKAGARSITNQLKAALCDFKGTLSGIVIQYIKLINELPTKEENIYVEDLEFEIFFEKA